MLRLLELQMVDTDSEILFLKIPIAYQLLMVTAKDFIQCLVSDFRLSNILIIISHTHLKDIESWGAFLYLYILL